MFGTQNVEGDDCTSLYDIAVYLKYVKGGWSKKRISLMRKILDRFPSQLLSTHHMTCYARHAMISLKKERYGSTSSGITQTFLFVI